MAEGEHVNFFKVFVVKRRMMAWPRADLAAYVVENMPEFADCDAKARGKTMADVVKKLEIGDKTGEKPPWVATDDRGRKWVTDRNAAWMTAWTIEKVQAAWDRWAAAKGDHELTPEIGFEWDVGEIGPEWDVGEKETPRAPTVSETGRPPDGLLDAVDNPSGDGDPWWFRPAPSKKKRVYWLAERGEVEELVEFMRKNYDPEFPTVGRRKLKKSENFEPTRPDPGDLVMRMACDFTYDVIDVWFELYGKTARTRPGQRDSLTGEAKPVPIGPTAVEIAALWWRVDEEKLGYRLKKLTRKALGRVKGVMRR